VARWVVYAYACGFMFGWHVHEKASLHMVIPFSILAVQSLQDAGDFIFVATVATYSLFPLLFEAKEYPIKVLLLVLYILVMWVSFAHNMTERGEPNSNKASVPISDSFVHQPGNLEKLDAGKNVEKQTKEEGMQLLSIFEKVYLAGLVLVEIYGQVLHPFFLREHLPFLPLMLISGYCSIGMLYFWAGQLFKIAFMSGFHTEQLPHMKKA
jgi:alpha-1,3-glucosyltransferase